MDTGKVEMELELSIRIGVLCIYYEIVICTDVGLAFSWNFKWVSMQHRLIKAGLYHTGHLHFPMTLPGNQFWLHRLGGPDQHYSLQVRPDAKLNP